MPQTTILAPGNSNATSSDIVVAAGSAATVGIFATTPAILPDGACFSVMQVTPGADNAIALLTARQNATVLAGPGTYRIKRVAYAGVAFGAFVEA